MMKKKQLLTYVALGVGGVILAVAGTLLVRSVLQYRGHEQAASRLRLRLKDLYRTEVFPSRENVVRERQNQAQLEQWFDRLITRLGEGNVDREDRSPSQFIGRLERTRAALRQQAERARIRLPDLTANFAFGFERYTGTGALPAPDDVPRLTEQLIVITRLTRMLFDSEIQSLQAIQRDVFEEVPAVVMAREEPTGRRSGGTTRRSGGAPVDRVPARVRQPGQPGLLQGDDMFATYRFVLEFEAREEALARLLNALASDPLFTVVRTLRMRKAVADMVVVRPEIVMGENAGGASGRRASAGADLDDSFLFRGDAASVVDDPASVRPGASGVGQSHPVSGIEMEIPMQVRMEIDVYKFRSADEPQD